MAMEERDFAERDGIRTTGERYEGEEEKVNRYRRSVEKAEQCRLVRMELDMDEYLCYLLFILHKRTTQICLDIMTLSELIHVTKKKTWKGNKHQKNKNRGFPYYITIQHYELKR